MNGRAPVPTEPHLQSQATAWPGPIQFADPSSRVFGLKRGKYGLRNSSLPSCLWHLIVIILMEKSHHCSPRSMGTIYWKPMAVPRNAGWLRLKESACSAGDLGSIPGGEDPLEKGTATHSGILAWRIPWMESPAGYSPWGRKEQDATEWLHFHFPFFTAMHLHLERVEGAAPHPPQTLALRELKVRKALLFNGCLVQLQKTLWTVARQAPLSTGLARQ